jgi:ubiquinone/menaquinone biosynthesis C-methylase UbiE
MKKQEFIPALRFHWLTNIYDWLISRFMPEKKIKQSIINNSNIESKFNVLDFGIGTATLSIMAYKTNPNASFIGLDIDNKILKLAKDKIEKENAKIDLKKYNGGNLPFYNSSFDRIMSSLVFHHLTTEQKLLAFSEFKRILKPNGEIHIADWGKASNIVMRLMFHLVQLLDGYNTTNDNIKGKLPTLIAQAGFDEIYIVQQFNTILGTIEVIKIKN